MTDLLDLLVFESIFSWVLIGITLSAIVILPRLFGLNFFNGLVYSQFTLFFNATTIIAGLEGQMVDIGRCLHFYFIEFSFLALTFAVYRYLLRYRAQVLRAIQKYLNGHGAQAITVVVAVMAVFNYLMAPTDGTSRIAYMTEDWFSFIKPIIQLIMPLAYLSVFILLLNPYRRSLGYVLLAVVVISNIATGSKASFAISLFTAFLVFRDLAGPGGVNIGKQNILKLSMFVGFAIIFALIRLEVSMADIVDRFFLSGEATILTYFSDTPTAACANVSTFASMHRGWARFLGDASAQDIDTLFGYALTIEKLGVNTFTGPNGRLSSYILCNFSDGRIFLGIFVVLAYLGLMLLLFKTLSASPRYLALVYPFMVTSLGGTSQDFNLLMQDVTIFLILSLPAFFFYTVPVRRQLG